ncbi:CoB--CoM heterodisulfide reductase iron-sulfur subunit A family protein [Desulfocurvibacter africanus]|uniref:CoB--CoM heterodisulfide reductase iron-sulfur subunit A family protein n=1 Tax=Desulfocurvibacter africanus TaxID=873 RepID=UPI000403EF58|nr:FAD-dependent oxidoreductase [Desulfocurvibacter africanus]
MSSKSILVIGGGFAGITSALEAAEMGHEVFLIEKSPFLGGRVMQLYKYFPKLCPPSCGLEIQFQRLKKAKDKVKVFTLAEVVSVNGAKGDYKVKVRIKPRYVQPNGSSLTEAAGELSATVENPFEFGLATRKPLYMDVPFAFPHRYVLDKDAATPEDLKKLAGNEYINLEETAKEIELDVGSIIVATGWKPYDLKNLTNLGGGKIKDAISNMQMERLASPNGPTGGKIVRPSDGNAPKSVAFVQCAGSRDENHLNYCSYICCMASLKQACYLLDQYPDARITIYYIDLRTPGRYETFLKRVLSSPNVTTVKGKVAAVEDTAGGKVLVTVENAITGIKAQDAYDLVVLATGMQPSLAVEGLPFDLPKDEEGFIIGGAEQGIFAAGCAKVPLDVMKSAQSATGAALKAIQTVVGR